MCILMSYWLGRQALVSYRWPIYHKGYFDLKPTLPLKMCNVGFFPFDHCVDPVYCKNSIHFFQSGDLSMRIHIWYILFLDHIFHGTCIYPKWAHAFGRFALTSYTLYTRYYTTSFIKWVYRSFNISNFNNYG